MKSPGATRHSRQRRQGRRPAFSAVTSAKPRHRTFSSCVDNGDSNNLSSRLPDREVDLPLTIEELSPGYVKRLNLCVSSTVEVSLRILAIRVISCYRPSDRVLFRFVRIHLGSSLRVREEIGYEFRLSARLGHPQRSVSQGDKSQSLIVPQVDLLYLDYSYTSS